MTSKKGWEVAAGILLIALGVLLLLGSLGYIDVGRALAILWPLVLIFLGLVILWGAARWRQISGPWERAMGSIHIGEGEWDLRDMDTGMGIGELRLDLSRARIPPGETSLRVRGGIGKIEIVVPLDLPVSAQAQVAIGSLNLLGHKAEGISRELSLTTPNYAQADRKVKVNLSLFLGEASLLPKN